MTTVCLIITQIKMKFIKIVTVTKLPSSLANSLPQIYKNCNKMINIPYVTGFWKTDRIVTLGLFHFIGPANGYTHTLHIHTVIIRLG